MTCAFPGGVRPRPGLLLVLVVIGALLGCSSPPRHVARFSVTDVAWLQLADALHARAAPMLELAPERAAEPLAGLAGRLREAHEAGRGRLRTLLVRAGAGGENPHLAHDMPGMPTAEELKALHGLRQEAFERRFAGLLRAYLKQLVLVADGERASGGAAEARELAAAMAREHTAELAELEEVIAA